MINANKSVSTRNYKFFRSDELFYMVGPMIYMNDTRRQAYPDIAGEIPGTRVGGRCRVY